MKFKFLKPLYWLPLIFSAVLAQAQLPSTPLKLTPQLQFKPKVLIVVAHPDDEYFFAATTYRITHDLGGTVDQVVITDGRGGFRYSLPSQPLYHQELTTAEVAAKKLPAIRKHELAVSGKILGIGKHFFLNHLDQKTLDLDETYKLWGGKDTVKKEIHEIVNDGHYDFIFTLLPTETNHGHHKAAGMLSLEVVSEMKAEARPTILASVARTDGESEDAIKQDDPEDARAYSSYRNDPLTKTLAGQTFLFDRDSKFGFKDNLSYQIIVSWMIAAHKSQGAFQNYYRKHRYEEFRSFTLNSPKAVQNAELLFHDLSLPTTNQVFTP